MHIPQLSSVEPQRRRQDGKTFLPFDMHIDEETAVCTLPDSIHIPMNLILPRSNELSDSLPTVVYCHHGTRSLHIVMYLADVGFETLYNFQGGIDAWVA